MMMKNGIFAQWLQIANCNHNRQFGWEVGSQLRSPDEVDCDEKLMQTTFCQSPGKYFQNLLMLIIMFGVRRWRKWTKRIWSCSKWFFLLPIFNIVVGVWHYTKLVPMPCFPHTHTHNQLRTLFCSALLSSIHSTLTSKGETITMILNNW